MADVRIVLVFDVFVVLLSFGAVWVVAGNPQSPNGYNGFDVASMVGGYVGGQQANPLSYQQTDYLAYTQAVLPPLIVGDAELDVALIAIPAALVLALASLARWQLSLPAGILAVAGGALWIGGIPAIARSAGTRLASWQGFGGGGTPIPVGSSLGPYIAVAGGAFLLTTYFMTRGGRLDTPLDTSPPTS